MNRVVLSVIAVAATASVVLAAPPPNIVSYQGFLRDSGGTPLSGSFNMVFRFYTAPGAGVLLLTDSHTGANAIAVTDGLFDTLLGSGIVTPGSQPNLGAVFQNTSNVYLEIQIGAEILLPRIHIGSVGHAINAGTVDGVAAGSFLRSDATDNYTSGTLTFNAGTTVDFAGTVEAARYNDRDSATYFLDPSSATTSLRCAGNLSLDTDTALFVGGTSANFTIAGSTLSLFLGDTTSDSVYITGRRLFMHDANTASVEGDQFIYFHEDNSNTGESFSWDDSADRFNLTDSLNIAGGDVLIDGGASFNSRLFFSNNTDDNIGEIASSGGVSIRLDTDNDESGPNAGVFVISANGLPGTPLLRLQSTDEANLELDNGVTTDAFDYAEAFKTLPGERDMQPGELVGLSLDQLEHCQRTTAAYAGNILGIVSTNPGFTCGMSFEAIERADPVLTAQRDAALARGDKAEANRIDNQMQDLMRQIWKPIALAGRVPCKVDGQFGAIKAGDRLTASSTPGHAMRMSRAGMSVGIAMEDFNGPGAGTIMVFVQPGWHGDSSQTATADAKDAQIADLTQRVAALEKLVATMAARK